VKCNVAVYAAVQVRMLFFRYQKAYKGEGATSGSRPDYERIFQLWGDTKSMDGKYCSIF